MVKPLFLNFLSTLCIASVICSAAPRPRVTVTRASIDVDQDGIPETVSVQMISGRRYNDTNVWCGMGEKYEGSFAVVVDIHGRRVETLLDPLLGGGPLWFPTQPWKLVMGHYNDDGQIDFNLGQYAGCNGWRYRLLSIRPTGRVEMVSLDFRANDFAPSTSQITRVENGFRVTDYSNARGGNWETTYRWNSTTRTFERESVRRID
jgi:hypothetical protein